MTSRESGLNAAWLTRSSKPIVIPEARGASSHTRRTRSHRDDVIIVAGHNLLDSISASTLGAWAPAWLLLHQQGPIMRDGQIVAFVAYPLLPWIGVMAVGYGLGPVFVSARRDQTLVRLAVCMLVAFLVFCMAASATYFLNDALDIHADRDAERQDHQRNRGRAAQDPARSAQPAQVPDLLVRGIQLRAQRLHPLVVTAGRRDVQGLDVVEVDVHRPQRHAEPFAGGLFHHTRHIGLGGAPNEVDQALGLVERDAILREVLSRDPRRDEPAVAPAEPRAARGVEDRGGQRGPRRCEDPALAAGDCVTRHEAALVLGASNRRIVARHILPNVLPLMIVAATLTAPGFILLEAGLSFFLALGSPDFHPSWGKTLEQSGVFIYHCWNCVFFPGAAIYVTTLAIYLVGIGLRDALDPRDLD